MFSSGRSIFGSPSAKPASSIFGSNPSTENSENKITRNVFGAPSTSKSVFASRPVASENIFGEPKKRPLQEPSDKSSVPPIKTKRRGQLPFKRRDNTARTPMTESKAVGESRQSRPASPLPVLTMNSSSDEKALLDVMRRPAPTDHDKYLVLDARDKWMRLKGLGQKRFRPDETGKQQNLRGVCPDMCPEKERYSRSAKNQLRIYEKQAGSSDVGDPLSMVKEYSRSSADQDVPLPHELRPSSVLKICMRHLLVNIIDRLERPEENLADWFEFVWSATRAIRKDITQQQLHDREAIRLVETCARFHIVCAARLVDSPLVMDSKLNNENLNACLQMVFQMYEDCDHEPSSSQNEPEFRAYHVLMNLNEPDDYMINSGKSWQLKVAKDLFLSFNNYNYVRFFKLTANRADVLQACILLRYFDQVRSDALERLVRAYCPKVDAKVRIEFTKLTDILMFEDEEHCERFFNHHHMTTDNSVVVLNRTAFYSTNQPLPIQRSYRLVEAKREGRSWSQIINGGERAEEMEQYNIHNSFDNQDRLKVEAYNASDIIGPNKLADEVLFEGEEGNEEEEEVEQEMEDEGDSDQDAEDEGNEGVEAEEEGELEEEAEEEEEEVEQETVEDELDSVRVLEASLVLTEELISSITSEVISQEATLLARQVIKEAQNEELMRRIEAENADNQLTEIASECFDQILRSILADIGSEEKKRFVERRESVMKFDEFLFDNVLNEVLVIELQRVLAEIVDEVRDTNRLMEQLQKKVKCRLLRKVLRHWLKVCRRKKLLRDFPATPSSLRMSEQLNRLGLNDTEPKSLEDVGNVLKLRDDVHLMINCVEKSDEIIHRLLKQQSDVIGLVKIAAKSNELYFANSNHHCFKCLLLLPSQVNKTTEEDEELNRSLLFDVIRHKLTSEDVEANLENNLLQLKTKGKYSSVVREVNDELIEQELALSEKKRRAVLWGTNALLLLHTDEEDIEDCIERLKNTLSLMPKLPPVPVGVASTSASSFRRIMGAFKGHRSVSRFFKVELPSDIFDPSLSRVLDGCLQSLISSATLVKPRNIIEMPLREFIYKSLDKFLWPKLHQLDGPESLTTLYNSVLTHLQKGVLSAPGLSEISYPVAELVREDSLPVYWSETHFVDIVCERIELIKIDSIDLGSSDSVKEQTIQWTKGVISKSRLKNGLEIDCLNSVLRTLRHCGDSRLLIGSQIWPHIFRIVVDYKVGLLDERDPFGDRLLHIGCLEEHFESFQFNFDAKKSIFSQMTNEKVKNGEKLTKNNAFDVTNGSKAIDESRSFEARLEQALGLRFHQ